MQRLQGLARGVPLVAYKHRGVLGALRGDLPCTFPVPSLYLPCTFPVGALRGEVSLLSLLDGPTLSGLPLSHHAFARRLLSSMTMLGYAHEQTALVLKAIFSAEADATTLSHAWLLFGGADWGAVRPQTAEEVADAENEYEARRREAKQQAAREAEAEARRMTEEKAEAERKRKQAEASGGSPAKSGWQKLRERRFKGGAIAAMVASLAAKKSIETPPVVLLGRVPRKSDFRPTSRIHLAEFERLVGVFGAYEEDPELNRCSRDFIALFAPLGQARAEEEADEDFQLQSTIGLDDFVDFILRLRPLAPGEKEEDRALMALANQIDFSANRKEPPKPPAWMTLGLVGADFLSEIETSDGKDEGRGGKGGKGGDTRGGDAGGGLPWWTAWVEGLRLRASAAAEGIRLLDGGGLIDVMEQLDEESKGLVPIAHVRTLMPAISGSRGSSPRR